MLWHYHVPLLVLFSQPMEAGILFAATCWDIAARIPRRIIATRHDFLPTGSFVIISNAFGPQLVEQK